MSVQIIIGDVREEIKLLPSNSVHCVVTSPPYWGLRDYGVDGQIGLEETPQQFVDEMVTLFREVHRVLRDDGTLWFNMGDSYAGSGRGGNISPDTSTLEGSQASQLASKIKRTRGSAEVGSTARDAAVTNLGRRATRGSQLPPGYHADAFDAGAIGRAWVPPPFGLKQKDLVGMPWRCAFALQADGWYLRQDIIWHKPNPMPESIGDRCTKAHEYLFLFSKSARYHYDAEAIAEGASANTHARVAKIPAGWETGPGTHGSFHRDGRAPGVSPKSAGEDTNIRAKGSFHASTTGVVEKRNKRSVWTVPTSPFSEAHFATFPPALIEPCILAGCPTGGVVLDPFGGAGTTGLVADRLQRNAILIELNPAYAAMARRRIDGDSPLFAAAAE
jgi:DNA modification methylase